MDRRICWMPAEGPGAEYLHLSGVPSGFIARANLVGAVDGVAFGLCYAINLDSGWRVRSVRLDLTGTEQSLGLNADGEGHWRDANGNALPELEGCIDLDISATPFTNTLPIRRLGLREGERRDLKVVYVDIPTLVPRMVRQRYTCLQAGKSYRYEGFPSGFVCDLPVDRDGLVLDYLGLFRRVAPDR